MSKRRTIVPEEMLQYRSFLGHHFFRGTGIEIGPGPNPIGFDKEKAKVKYVDYAPIERIRAVYADIPDNYIKGDIIDDGAVLKNFPDEALNFITSCHMLEHTENPVAVLRTWLKKLKKNGVLLIVIPDKRSSFDKHRDLTTWDHFVEDFEKGPEVSRDAHYLEFASINMDAASASEVADKAARLQAMDYRIHFHVWDPASFLKFIQNFISKYDDASIEHFGRNHTEISIVLRK